MLLHNERERPASGADDHRCVHWWLLSLPDSDDTVEARCKLCGERRTFDGGRHQLNRWARRPSGR
jgi:hypothetical protein